MDTNTVVTIVGIAVGLYATLLTLLIRSGQSTIRADINTLRAEMVAAVERVAAKGEHDVLDLRGDHNLVSARVDSLERGGGLVTPGGRR